MRKIWRWILIALGIILPTTTTCVNDDFNNEDYNYMKIEDDIFTIVNDHRKKLNLSECKKSSVISLIATEHCVYMISQKSASHDKFAERANELMTTYKFKTVGEVVAYGFNGATGVVQSWIKSDSHRHVIENSKWTHFGVSVMRNEKGRNYFTLIFARV